MMKRPVMNPMFLDDDAAAARPAGPPRWRRIARFLGRCVKLLFTDLFRRFRKEKVRNDVGTPFSRFCRAVLYRLAFVPVFLALLVLALVVTATHPHRVAGVSDPTSEGVYYDPVELLSLDNTKLEGWLVPVLDARRVLVEKDEFLHKKHPAIVLVHDFGASRQQVLPLVVPFHEAGYVVLAINLRGQGPSASAGSTFGLNEAHDVRAAVELLRRRPFVDANAVGVLGIGTGATAALLAAQQDGGIRALVLDHPIRGFQDVLNERIGPRNSLFAWVRPMCKWAFEIGYKVDADDIDLTRFAGMMAQRSVLLFDDPGESVSCTKATRTRQTVQFLQKHLVVRAKAVPSPIQRRQEIRELAPQPAEAPAASKGGESWPPQRPAKQLFEELQKGAASAKD
jgi:alpha-beta hydrolase superfamily lysophospholipase